MTTVRTISVSPDASAVQRRRRLLLFVILLLALGLRVWGLGEKSLWFDETMTVENASRPYAAMIEWLKEFDVHPPLYQSLIWLWLRLGRGEAFVRLPSALAGVVGVWLAYLAARRLLGPLTGLAAAFLMAVSAFQVYYAQEARLNVFVAVLFLAQINLLFTILHRRIRAGWGIWAAYGAVIAASLFTYALCILTIGAGALLYVWLAWRRGPDWRRLVAVHAAVGILFFQAWYPALRQRTTLLKESIARHHDAAGRPGVGQLAAGVTAWGFGRHVWEDTPAAVGGLCVMLLLTGGMAVAARRGRRPLKALAVLFLVPLIGYLALPMPRAQAYDPKHLIFLQPLVLIAFASVRGPAGGTRWQRAKPLFYALVAATALNGWALRVYFSPQTQKENWRAAFAEVTHGIRPEDALVFDPDRIGFAFDYYAGTPEGKAAVRFLAERGRDMPPSVRCVWVVECRSDVAKPSKRAGEALRGAGWKPKSERIYPGLVGQVKTALYVRDGAGGTP